jgi:hypothetical protein
MFPLVSELGILWFVRSPSFTDSRKWRGIIQSETGFPFWNPGCLRYTRLPLCATAELIFAELIFPLSEIQYLHDASNRPFCLGLADEFAVDAGWLEAAVVRAVLLLAAR